MASVTKKVKRAVNLVRKKRNRQKARYAYCLNNMPIVENRILIESFGGKNLSDSPLYVLKEIMRTGRASDYEIYYASNKPEEHINIASAMNLPVTIVDVTSNKFAEILATSKYLLNNSSFQHFFIKREGQIYVQTWHGVPLKTLGKRMRLGTESMNNVQHNFLQADILTFPNDFTRNVIMRDYNLDDLYTGKVAMIGYPRNDIFRDKQRAAEIRRHFNLDEIESFAYMPTWRGTSNHTIDIDDYERETQVILGKIDNALNDQQHLFVNFHSVVADKIKLGNYRHISSFPKIVDTYDFLNAVDALITDYSSVFFDFAISGKPIILFLYDIEQYEHDRGLYFSVNELPFKKTYTTDDLIACLTSGNYRNHSYSTDVDFTKYLEYETKNNSAIVMKLLLDGAAEEKNICKMIDYAKNKEKSWKIREFGAFLDVADFDKKIQTISPENEIAIFLKNQFTEEMSAHLYDNYVDDFNYLFIVNDQAKSYREVIMNQFSKKCRKKLRAREKQRRFADLNVQSL